MLIVVAVPACAIVAWTGLTALPVPAATAAVAAQEHGVLGPGLTGPAVATWQQLVNRWIRQEVPGRPEIAVDGRYGPETEQATSELQQHLGVAVDGIAGPETRAALDGVLRPSNPSGDVSPTATDEVPLLTVGHAGASVLDWQRQLNRWRRAHGRDVVAEDGVYGLVTASATRQFQAAVGLVVDGVVGPNTRLALARALTGSRPLDPTRILDVAGS
jgi:peptidoglycan hydrolase-like protein with peptidoglycan-binding domain